MIEFIAAVYNEENQIDDLIEHVWDYVDKINICDDGSTDDTFEIIKLWWMDNFDDWDSDKEGKVAFPMYITHTGLPETVKREALKMCREDSWVIMLDADERFAPGHLEKVIEFIKSPQSENYSHIWFNLEEAIDGQITRYFIKCRVFRKSAVSFADTVHVADSFSGNGFNGGWTVLHHKTSTKQIQREREYLETYDRLIAEGKMTQEKKEELKGMHYFIK